MALSQSIYDDVSNLLGGGSGGGGAPNPGSASTGEGVAVGPAAVASVNVGVGVGVGGAQRAPPPLPPAGSVSHDWQESRRREAAVNAAEYLLQEKFLLTALELHQELMERTGGMHDVGVLNTFFGTGSAGEGSVAHAIAAESASNAAISAALPALAAVPSPFDPYSTLSSMEERDQQIALLAYKLRCSDEDKDALQTRLDTAERQAVTPPLVAGNGAGGAGGGGGAAGGRAGSAAGGRPSSRAASTDPSEPISDHERRVLNVLVKQYLMATGYKLAAVTFAEEAADQDLDDIASVGLHIKTTSLLGLHRDRLAPLEEAADVKEQLDEAEATIAKLKATLSDKDAELKRMKDEVETVNHKLAAALRAKAAAVQSMEVLTQATDDSSTYVAGRPNADGEDTALKDVEGNLVLTMGATLPGLSKNVVTKQRITLLPLFASAVAAHPSPETRRSLMSAMLTLVKRPTYANRAVIVKAVADLASDVGGLRCEQELMPQVLAMATHKARERRAVAAEACGALAQYVSDKRCDSLLATLTMLADDEHALVRRAVATGMAKLADTLSQTESSESRRQYAEVEDLMWRSLLEGSDAQTTAGVEHGATAVNDDADLWDHEDADPENRDVVSTVLSDALPVIARWARSLGWLWSRLVPQLLSILRDTLTTAAPTTAGGSVHSGSRSVGSRASSDVDGNGVRHSVPVSMWHQNRCAALLTALQRLAPLLGKFLLQDGYLINHRDSYKPTASAGDDAAEEEQKHGDGAGPGSGSGSGSAKSRLYRIAGSAEPCDAAAGEFSVLEGVVQGTYRLANGTGLESTAAAAPAADDGGVDDDALKFVFGDDFDLDTVRSTALAFGSVMAGRAHVEWMALDDVKGAASDDEDGGDAGGGEGDAKEPSEAAGGDAASPWSKAQWGDIRGLEVEWDGLRCIVHDTVPQLMEDASSLDRGSAVGRSIIDQYAAALRRVCSVMGTHFIAHTVRPMFKSALGLSLRGAAGSSSVHDASHSRDHTLLRKVLFGAAAVVPTTPQAQTIKSPASTHTTDEFGEDVEWYQQLSTLEWIGFVAGGGGGGGSGSGAGDSTPTSTSGGGGGGGSEAWGSAWRAETLLPLFASGLLSCPGLPEAHLRGALRELIVRVAQKSDGWGLTQSLMETVFVRVGRHPRALPRVLSLLQRVATNSQAVVRAVVAGLLQSLVPVLTTTQVNRPVLPCLQALAADSSAMVVKSAVRALTSLYLEVSDLQTLELVNAEVARMLERGPKAVIVEVMRALMRGIPRADPELRDGFMLKQVLGLGDRLCEAAQAGSQELKDICAAIGDVGDEERSAAEQAATAAREAAVQLHAPWDGARLEDLEEVAMVTLECMRAFGSCLLPEATRSLLIPALRKLLLDAELVEASYRDMMVATLAAMGLGLSSGGGPGDETGDGFSTPAGADADPAPDSPFVPSGFSTPDSTPRGHRVSFTSPLSPASGGGSAGADPPTKALSFGSAAPATTATAGGGDGGGAGGGGGGMLPSTAAAADNPTAVTVMSLDSFSGGAAAGPPSPLPAGSASTDAGAHRADDTVEVSLQPHIVPATMPTEDGTPQKKRFGKMIGKFKGFRDKAKARMKKKKDGGKD